MKFILNILYILFFIYFIIVPTVYRFRQMPRYNKKYLSIFLKKYENIYKALGIKNSKFQLEFNNKKIQHNTITYKMKIKHTNLKNNKITLKISKKDLEQEKSIQFLYDEKKVQVSKNYINTSNNYVIINFLTNETTSLLLLLNQSSNSNFDLYFPK